MSKHLGDESFSGNRIKEIGAPVDKTDATNKKYVDDLVGASVKSLWDTKDIVQLLEEDEDHMSYLNYISSSSGNWTAQSGYRHWVINVEEIRKVTVVANANNSSHVSFLVSHDSYASGTVADFATGYETVHTVQVGAGSTKSFVVPTDAKFLYLNTGNNFAAKAAHIYLTGIGITEYRGDGTGFVKDDGTVDTTKYQEALPPIIGNANRVLAVTNGEDDVEWVPLSGGTSLPSYTGNAGKVLSVNNTEDGVEWKHESGGYNLDAGTDLEIAQSYVPDGYTEQISVYNSSSTRHNTGIIPTVDDVVMEIKVKPTTGAWYIFQSRDSSGNVNGIGGQSSNARIYGQFCDSGQVISDITRTTSHWYTIRLTVKSGNLTLCVKDETAGTTDIKTGTYTFTTPTLPIYIWGDQQGHTVPANNYIEYAWIKVGGVKKMLYIPAKRNSDNKAGFWDLVSGTFKETTRGSANAGGDATSHNVINFTNDTGYAVLPSYSSGDAEKVLAINNDGTGYEWKAMSSSGQVNADWDATSGVAEILNKPTIPSTPKELGISFGSCTDNVEDVPTNPFDVDMETGYALKSGGLIAVEFANPLPASRQLNIGGQTMSVYYKGSIVAADVILGGDTVILQTINGVNSWYCNVLSNDRWNVSQADIAALPNTLMELDDTSINDRVQNGRVLAFNSSTNKWVDKEENTMICTATLYTHSQNEIQYTLDKSPRDIHEAALKGMDIVVIPMTAAETHGEIVYAYHFGSMYKYNTESTPPVQYMEFVSATASGSTHSGATLYANIDLNNWADSTRALWTLRYYDDDRSGIQKKYVQIANNTRSYTITAINMMYNVCNYLIDNSNNNGSVNIVLDFPLSGFQPQNTYFLSTSDMTVAQGAVAKFTVELYSELVNQTYRYYYVVTRDNMQKLTNS